MTTAIIGTGGIGSVIARQLASGGETLRLEERRRACWGVVGLRGRCRYRSRVAGRRCRRPRAAVCRAEGRHRRDRRAAHDKLAVVPATRSASNHKVVSRLLPNGQSSGEVIAGWLLREWGPSMALEPCRPTSSSPVATGHRNWRSSSTRPTTTVLTRRLSGSSERRLRAGEDRRDRTVQSARGGRRPSRSCSRPHTGAVIDRWGLIASPPRPGALGVRSQKWPRPR